jgi:hypothetical protein
VLALCFSSLVIYFSRGRAALWPGAVASVLLTREHVIDAPVGATDISRSDIQEHCLISAMEQDEIVDVGVPLRRAEKCGISPLRIPGWENCCHV